MTPAPEAAYNKGMMSHTNTMPRRSGVGSDDGFTLTELLVVIGIIALLLGMLTPSLHQAIKVAWRSTCAANLKTIANGCSQYALASRKKALPTVFTKDDSNDPDNNPGHDTWANINVTEDKQRGNVWCLWLLVEDKRVGREAFLCPEAESERGWRAPPLAADGFKVEVEGSGETARAKESTISYSYISTTRKREWYEKLAEKMTLDGTPGTLVIAADQNPRCILGQTAAEMKPRAKVQSEINSAETRGEKMMVRNSKNHARKGQNMARLGGSVHWCEDPNGPDEDDIYFSSIQNEQDEKKGRRKQKTDSFVIP